jgi:ferredoxin
VHENNTAKITRQQKRRGFDAASSKFSLASAIVSSQVNLPGRCGANGAAKEESKSEHIIEHDETS